jgi:pilus assembly protein CpaB
MSGKEVTVQIASGEHQATGALSRRLLAVASALGLLGGGLLLLYLNRFEEEVSGGRRVQVLSVVQPIERGALITTEALAVSEVPIAYVEQRAVRAADKSKVVGIRAAQGLDAQDTLLWTDLAISSESRDLASLVQPGKRAVTVRASEAGSDPAGSGLLRPGDYVDVLVTLRDDSMDGKSSSSSIVLLQRVLVLAVGSKTEPQGFRENREQRSSYARERELTLSLKTEEVQLLSLARERGILSVALRDPTDTKIVEGIADMPLSVLYDKKSRESVQRRRTEAQGPVRLTQGEP